MPATVGDLIGVYRLEELIGKGAFGQVFRAHAETAGAVPAGTVVALKVLHDLHKDDARIVHRVGVVAAGDQIVLIVTGAEHRVAALGACHWLIDELKLRVPIWKKEITPQGESWVTPHP